MQMIQIIQINDSEFDALCRWYSTSFFGGSSVSLTQKLQTLKLKLWNFPENPVES